MLMAVMCIRKMRMFVADRFVTVRMDMGGLGHRIVVVPMVPIVVDMRVCMRGRHMFVFVFVMFCEVEPNAERHQAARNQQTECQGFGEERDCDHRTYERGDGEVRPGPRGPEFAQRNDKQNKAYAIAEEPDNAGRERGERRRQGSSCRNCQAHIGYACNRPFDGRNLERIG